MSAKINLAELRRRCEARNDVMMSHELDALLTLAEAALEWNEADRSDDGASDAEYNALQAAISRFERCAS